METLRLIGRNSRLSLLQMEIVRNKIEAAFPGIGVKLVARDSRGDSLPDVPLHTVEGSDFFTKDIFEKLDSGEADIAVHSLKDMSADHFFGDNVFAVVERDDPRDVAIFNAEVLQKIKNGESIVIGTCSPRREEMATGFLQKSLPQLNDRFKVTTQFIRGNVDTRLRKLDKGEYDGIILAAAGLNRLLNSREDANGVKDMLQNKFIMILPLLECVPAPCQGAIVAEANTSNKRATEILSRINDAELMNDCIQEKKAALPYGTGCIQKFGVTTLSYDGKKVLYAGGTDTEGTAFSHWYGSPNIDADEKILFNSADFMGEFFEYDFLTNHLPIELPVAYISNHKAVHRNEQVEQLKRKRVWAAGSKTWFALAKKGIWVEGCADGLGLQSLEQLFSIPLLKIRREEVCIVTNKQSEQVWQRKGWNSLATYSLRPKKEERLRNLLVEADIILWTSFHQYRQYRSVLKQNVIHCCPAGETVELFRASGIEPVVFPTIKSFQEWRNSSIRSLSVA